MEEKKETALGFITQEQMSKEILYPRGVDLAKVISVIVTTAARGSGEPGQPVRIVTQYWSLNGKKLAENDPLGN